MTECSISKVVLLLAALLRFVGEAVTILIQR